MKEEILGYLFVIMNLLFVFFFICRFILKGCEVGGSQLEGGWVGNDDGGKRSSPRQNKERGAKVRRYASTLLAGSGFRSTTWIEQGIFVR